MESDITSLSPLARLPAGAGGSFRWEAEQRSPDTPPKKKSCAIRCIPLQSAAHALVTWLRLSLSQLLGPVSWFTISDESVKSSSPAEAASNRPQTAESLSMRRLRSCDCQFAAQWANGPQRRHVRCKEFAVGFGQGILGGAQAHASTGAYRGPGVKLKPPGVRGGAGPWLSFSTSCART